jgi:excinuclease UvrABC nuclease subunit
MEEYRLMVLEACRCAAGGRAAARQSLEAEMRRLAGEKQYEQAGNVKTRLARLAELERPRYAQVAAAEEFQYILIQPSRSPRAAKVFLVDRGFVKVGRAPLAYPPSPGEAEGLLAAMAAFTARGRRVGRRQREVIALVAHYLFGSAERRGLILRYAPSLTGERIAEQVASAAKAVRLRPSRRQKRSESETPIPNQARNGESEIGN